MKLHGQSRRRISKIIDEPSSDRQQWLKETSETLYAMPLERIEDLCHPDMSEGQNNSNGTGLARQITARTCDHPGEAYAMLLVQAKTSIPTPKVLRMFHDEESDKCTVILEKIEGKTLENHWETLSLWQKFRVAKILRRYVQMLSRMQTSQIRLQMPGPVLGERRDKGPKPCVGWVDDEDAGPFEFQSEMADWFNERLRRSYDFYDTDSYMIPFDHSKPLVFVLGSLSMDKIIIDDEGCLWLTDFSRAGIYPPWFEYCGMRSSQGKQMSRSWKWVRIYVCGPYGDQEGFLRQVNKVSMKSRKWVQTRKLTKTLHRLSRRPTVQAIPEIRIVEPSN